MTLKMKKILWTFFGLCEFLAICKAETCFSPTSLPLAMLRARCTASSDSMGTICDHALDGNPMSYWMPDLSQSQINDIFYVIIFEQEIQVSRIDLHQLKWAQGYATEIRLEFDPPVPGMTMKLEVDRFGRSTNALPYQVKTSRIEFTVIKIDRIMFGGIKEIRLYGCNNFVVRPKPGSQSMGYILSPDEFSSSQRPADPDKESSFFNWVIGVVVGGIIVIFVGIGIWFCMKRPKGLDCFKDIETPLSSTAPSQSVLGFHETLSNGERAAFEGSPQEKSVSRATARSAMGSRAS